MNKFFSNPANAIFIPFATICFLFALFFALRAYIISDYTRTSNKEYLEMKQRALKELSDGHDNKAH